MKNFAKLYRDLDRTTSSNEKIAALATYFTAVPPEDAAWTIALFAGQRPKKPVTRSLLRNALLTYLKIDEWMLEESHALVGDLGETFALMIDTLRPEKERSGMDHPLHVWMEELLPSLANYDEVKQVETLGTWWDALPAHEIFVLQKLIGGGLRVGVSKAIIIQALAKTTGSSIPSITQKLTGKWKPTAEFFAYLTRQDSELSNIDPSQPYPFALAYPLDKSIQDLGDVSDWSAEWKWDGIRAQIVRRDGACFIWSRGEDLITDSFPDIAHPALTSFPDGTVLDGELLVFGTEGPRPFADLQKRIGRKKPGQTTLGNYPAQFMSYDILEMNGEDLRDLPFKERRRMLEGLFPLRDVPFRISPLIKPKDWEDLAQARAMAREQKVEGLMLKHENAPYRAGRKKGDWWKWKVDPLTIDAVLLYAQAGSGRRANLFTDYTFGVWEEGGTLVPVAKAYSGLNNEEISELDRWIRSHTKEKFGPVRSVELEHVFEIGFEAIQESNRHKAGIALRFPRILRWRKDKPVKEADQLATVKALLHEPETNVSQID